MAESEQPFGDEFRARTYSGSFAKLFLNYDSDHGNFWNDNRNFWGNTRFCSQPDHSSGLAGRNVSPISQASTARAHSRPSQIAHTTSDWPRRVSPAANTPGTLEA